MNDPSDESGLSSTWLLIAGLLLGAALLGFMAWDSSSGGRAHMAASGEVIELTTANWKSEVLESKVAVLVDFGATWCGPCRKLEPIIDRLAEQYKGKVKMGRVDVDKSPELAERYHVAAYPHVFIFYAGEKQESLEGLRSEGFYVKRLDSLLAHVGAR